VPANLALVKVFEFEPSGVIFSKPIKVTFEYDPNSNLLSGADPANLSAIYYDENTTEWADCDYTVDTESETVTANLSHFSVYALVLMNGAGSSVSGPVAISWNLVGIIVGGELLLGGLAAYFFMRRRRTFVPVVETVGPANLPEVTVQAPIQRLDLPAPERVNVQDEGSKVNWDTILHENKQRGEPFKTDLEIIGGKVMIPRDGKSSDIELVNMPDTRIIISLEYDPELHPRGLAKIVVLGSTKEYEKSKEIGK
jgi:hypothetical protein